MSLLKSKKNKILFISKYIEALKVYLYFAEHLAKKGYDCSFICQYDNTESKLANEALIKSTEYRYKMYKSVYLPDTPIWQLSFFFKASLLFLYPVYLNLIARKNAKQILNDFSPDVCIFSVESEYLERQLLYLCRKSNIISFVYQFTFSSPSLKIANKIKELHTKDFEGLVD